MFKGNPFNVYFFLMYSITEIMKNDKIKKFRVVLESVK